MADLTKAGLSIPPQVAELQDIGHLNRISVEKAKSRLSVVPKPHVIQNGKNETAL